MDKHLPSLLSEESPFDSIKHVENCYDHLSARDLQNLLDYTKWSNFEETIKRAMVSCRVAGQEVSDHFTKTGKMVQSGSGSRRKVVDYHLTRFACYSIAMNCDVEKPSTALTQTYFNIQTRKAELAQLQHSVTSQSPINSLWQKRMDLFNEHTKISDGYWCIFNITASYCWSQEFQGIHLNKNAEPDISVVLHWCRYARDVSHLDMSFIQKYPHHYPHKRRLQSANIYPNAWLGLFFDWFQRGYMRYEFPVYIKTHLDKLQIQSTQSAKFLSVARGS